MTNRFSIEGAPLISNIMPSNIRTSTVYPVTTIGSFQQPRPTVGPVTVAAQGVRRSRVITADQIPPGAEIVRIERPPEYHYRDGVNRVDVTEKRVIEPLPIRQIDTNISQRRNFPCWCWSILLLLGLILLASCIYFFASRFANKNQERHRSSQNIGQRDGNRQYSSKNQNSQNVRNIRNGQNTRNVVNNGNEVNSGNVQQREEQSNLKQQRGNIQTNNPENDEEKSRQFQNTTRTNTRAVSKKCEEGFFVFNGKCIQCPSGSSWNGANCVSKEQKSANSNSVQKQNQEPQQGQANQNSQQTKSSNQVNIPSDEEKTSSNTQQQRQNQGDENNNNKDEKTNGNRAPEETNLSQFNSNSKDDNQIGNVANSAVNGVVSGVSSVAKVTGDMASNLWEGTKSLTKNAGDAAAKTWEGMKDVGNGITSAFDQNHLQAHQGFFSSTRRAGRGIYNGISDVGRGTRRVGSRVFGGIERTTRRLLG